jgi:hypothetical protein
MDTPAPTLQAFQRERMTQTVTLPSGPTSTAYPFQWMLFKPQAHAVTPFQTNMPSRLSNSLLK